jgi:hypothetical protein
MGGDRKLLGSSFIDLFLLRYVFPYLKNGMKKICRINYKYHLRSNSYEVCTAVALCFQNILDVMVLENINLSSDKNRASVMIQTWISVISQLHVPCQQCIFQLHVSFICTWTEHAVFNFSKKITCFAFYLVL